MRPSFHPRLVNGPFHDPGLYIPFLYENRAVLFDMGDVCALSARELLKTTQVFVTHTHMDHFIGFDRLLRLCLGREKTLYMFGPEGFLKNVEGKLAGYAWNLVSHYRNRFNLEVGEVQGDRLISRRYRCRKGFAPDSEPKIKPFSGVLLQEPAFSVSAVILDHRIPCLGLSITERFHINIKKDAVLALGLEIGPWLREFKEAVFNNQDPDSFFQVKTGTRHGAVKQFRLGDLTNRIAIITPGQKITYIADVVYNVSESEKMSRFAANSDHLYIEAAFLEKDSDIAREKYHLTAWQAGTIAGSARVKQFTPFHFSPRYTGRAHLLEEEARAAYQAAVSDG